MNSLHNRDKLRQHLQTPLSPKRKTFARLFFAFLKSKENFPHFEEKDQLHSSNILEVIESEECGYLNATKLLFQNSVRESTCKRLRNTDELFMVAVLCKVYINPKKNPVTKDLS